MDRTSVINTLADKLPDNILEELFPAIPATAVRDVLLGKKKVAAQPARQQKLFTEPADNTTLSCRLFTDGASRGNPGEAGAGIVLLDDDNQELIARSLYLGRSTNNVAEYKALVLGLETAIQLGCSQLSIFMDSQLIVRQVQGRYKVKNANLKPLFDKVKGLLANINKWSIDHVPRAQNKRADELANRGIDERTGIRD
ncbi:MAG: ribonuclease HI family protein [Thermodesulfobacteriota bacterium]|nr:ribonuclease HI family protein [Thermodesulfobacteriota bacterium]